MRSVLPVPGLNGIYKKLLVRVSVFLWSIQEDDRNQHVKIRAFEAWNCWLHVPSFVNVFITPLAYVDIVIPIFPKNASYNICYNLQYWSYWVFWWFHFLRLPSGNQTWKISIQNRLQLISELNTFVYNVFFPASRLRLHRRVTGKMIPGPWAVEFVCLPRPGF